MARSLPRSSSSSGFGSLTSPCCSAPRSTRRSKGHRKSQTGCPSPTHSTSHQQTDTSARRPLAFPRWILARVRTRLPRLDSDPHCPEQPLSAEPWTCRPTRKLLTNTSRLERTGKPHLSVADASYPRWETLGRLPRKVTPNLARTSASAAAPHGLAVGR